MNDAARLFNTPAAIAVGANLTINQESTPMARHTIMPPRNQKTPLRRRHPDLEVDA